LFRMSLRAVLPCPFVQIDASPPRLARSVYRKEGLDAFSFTANRERIKEFVPAFSSFRQIGSFRTAFQPLIQFDGHGRKKLAPVHSISQMVTIDAASGIPGGLMLTAAMT
jgi:hypothetical protein